jgi:hypothetical protein
LGLTALSFGGLHIKLGDGHSVLVTDRCLPITVCVGTYTFVLDALVLDTGELDLILGMEWLNSLGEVIHNWHQGWMKFMYQGITMKLQGLSKGHSVSAVLQQWSAQDDGPLLLTDAIDSSPGLPNFSIDLPSSKQAALRAVFPRFVSVFQAPSGLPPTRPHDHRIILSSYAPICVRPYQYPHIQKTEIERQVNELLGLGMILPSRSAYASPVILVRKKDNTWRMCVDYRALNNATVPDKFPIPVVDELLDELHGA